jgi:tRNA U34 5-methylaminomethyl-2-thiouridine-forming methyltransferase MnmC
MKEDTSALSYQFIETGDGSHTLYHPQLDETYHSRKGALTESLHVFIKEGMNYQQALPELHILEIGFGTGLNAILALQHAEEYKRRVCYTSLELYPLHDEIATKLNYNQFLEEWLHPWFAKMHTTRWQEVHTLTPYFTLHKIDTGLEQYHPKPGQYNLVFFDAFAPQKQPDLWTIPHFEKLFQALQPGGILVSYCSSGEFRRNLKAAGFEVSKIPGPPGKREMVRATKSKT